MYSDLTYDDYCWDEKKHGFRQRELVVTQIYDKQYLQDRYESIDDKVKALSAKRLQMLESFIPQRGWLLDFGCGTGRFVEAAIKSGWDAMGFDIVPGDKYRATIKETVKLKWDVVTFFDSLEHLVNPHVVLESLNAKYVMVSVPECHFPNDPKWFMNWKHRRPGEHLWHWNMFSLSRLFKSLGYKWLMVSSFEDEFRPRYCPNIPNILTAIYHRK